MIRMNVGCSHGKSGWKMWSCYHRYILENHHKMTVWLWQVKMKKHKLFKLNLMGLYLIDIFWTITGLAFVKMVFAILATKIFPLNRSTQNEQPTSFKFKLDERDCCQHHFGVGTLAVKYHSQLECTKMMLPILSILMSSKILKRVDLWYVS